MKKVGLALRVRGGAEAAEGGLSAWKIIFDAVRLPR